jgi:hypothetical protein
LHNAAFGWIPCPLCRHITEIELPNNLNSDVEFLRLVAEWRSVKEIIAKKDEACNNQLLEIADLQQQVDLCREMHGKRVRMSSTTKEQQRKEHTQNDLYSGLPQVKERFSYAH